MALWLAHPNASSTLGTTKPAVNKSSTVTTSGNQILKQEKLTIGMDGFLPTGAGWLMFQMSLAAVKFTSSPIRAPAGNG